MNKKIETIKRNVVFTNITNVNIDNYKKLRKIYAKYKIQTLRNHGEFPGNKKMFENLFDSIISNASGNNPNRFIVMQSNNNIIGFASISTSSKDVIDIPYKYGVVKDFYISPKYRRNGFGRILNEHIESIFKINKTSVILLSPDPVSGINFWRAIGYCDTGIHQGWGKHFVFIKHITKTEYSLEINNAIQNLVTPTDLIGINPYNKPQIKEADIVWKEYCREKNRKFHKNDVKKLAFNARNNKTVSFKTLYFEGKIIGLYYIGDETIRYILPEYKNRGFEKELKNESLEIKKI